MLKRNIIITILSFLAITCYAQYSASNSIMRTELVSYHKNAQGYYEATEGRMIDMVDNIAETYAYDKEAQNLYVLTDYSNVVITLDKDYAKVIKKNKYIPQLKADALDAQVRSHNDFLRNKFDHLNNLHRMHINDSINQAYKDSVDRVRKAEFNAAAEKSQLEDYRSTHRAYFIPFIDTELYCTKCNQYFSTEDIYSTLGIANDSIYYAVFNKGDLGKGYFEFHKSKIPESLAEDDTFKLHIEAFKDSITDDSKAYNFLMSRYDYISLKDYLDELAKIAPYGYFNEWGWGDDYTISFSFKYTNTNKKTIKYIRVYFKAENAVGDTRSSGYFQGTGPLELWETASWNWDSSSYVVAGDTSKFTITKVLITYMNGSTHILTGKNIVFN